MCREILNQIRITHEEDTGKLKKIGAGAGAEVVTSCLNIKTLINSWSSVTVDCSASEDFVTFSSFFLLQVNVSKAVINVRRHRLFTIAIASLVNQYQTTHS